MPPCAIFPAPPPLLHSSLLHCSINLSSLSLSLSQRKKNPIDNIICSALSNIGIPACITTYIPVSQSPFLSLYLVSAFMFIVHVPKQQSRCQRALFCLIMINLGSKTPILTCYPTSAAFTLTSLSRSGEGVCQSADYMFV